MRALLSNAETVRGVSGEACYGWDGIDFNRASIGPVDLKEDIKTPPSEMFENCVRSSGSIVIDCELCGRTHFGTGGDFEEGEFEALVKKAEANPEKYIQHGDDDMVSYGYVQGKQAVIGCPCNGLYRIENFILTHKFLITEFLCKYAEAKTNEAFQLQTEAFKAQRAMDTVRTLEQEAVKNLKDRKENKNGKVRKFDLD